eukprot:3942894-Alexandrium_andersonii.AAC.1
MSASLVGSEMCIRDSVSSGRVSADAACPLQGLPRVPISAWARTRTPRSVSYTHLTLPTICSV